MNNKHWDMLWINAVIATMKTGNVAYGLLENAALAVKNGKVAWIGSMLDLQASPEALASTVKDVQGKCITPGFIDCHTHLVYAGNRCHEYAMRLSGASYEAIAKAGGGIRSTVLATRAASEEALLEQSLKRARALMQSGVTTLEIKSGYGLDLETEVKILRVAKKIAEILSVHVVTTFLGAHTVPLEYQEKADAYIDVVCDQMIPVIAREKLADNVDVFCETIGFTLSQTEKVFKTAKKYGLGIKCHAEQLSNSGSARMAASYQALSVDHLEHLSEEGVKALAGSGTVAVLLPGAFYFLKETHKPPVALLREYKVPMAIASDCNPGTSPVTSLLLILNMACTLFGLTPEEALLGVTRHAARALGLEKTHGTLEVDKIANIVVWDVKHPEELVYYLGMDLLLERAVGC
jgi:imidazolonepropionase